MYCEKNSKERSTSDLFKFKKKLLLIFSLLSFKSSFVWTVLMIKTFSENVQNVENTVFKTFLELFFIQYYQ